MFIFKWAERGYKGDFALISINPVVRGVVGTNIVTAYLLAY